MSIRLPSIFHIIRVDYLAITLAVVPLALWALFGVIYLLPAVLNAQAVEVSGFLLLLLVAVTLYSLLALAWRVSNIRAVFVAGIHVQGTITGVWFFRSRGQICFSYNYLGSIRDAKMTLIKNQCTRTLQKGATLDLLVDPDNPDRTFLQSLFI
jgi:hypothetical protein